MANLAYLECPTGIAGDMCLGALVHAGVPLAYLIEQLKRLKLTEEYELKAELVQRSGQQATKVHVLLNTASIRTAEGTQVKTHSAIESIKSDEAGVDSHSTFAHHDHSSSAVHLHSPHPSADTQPQNHEAAKLKLAHERLEPDYPAHNHGTRHLPEIEQLIIAAGLPPRVTAQSLAIFRQLAQAEGAVHGILPEQVHFHEVGATDAIVDIVGTCLGLDWLNIDQLYCSALPTGGGTVRAAHGQLPVPAPAVLKLWEMRQVPIYSNGIQRELVTPTGAAIVTTLAARFGFPPALTLQKVGLGAGSRNLAIPNILRLWLGVGEAEADDRTRLNQESSTSKEKPETNASRAFYPSSPEAQSPLQEPIALLETQIDDLNPQAIGYVYDALFAAGAVDVFTQAIGMKKSRPGVLMSVVCHPDQVAACETILFRETTTLGIRHSMQNRSILHREMQTVTTKYGTVTLKVARRSADGAIVTVQPEYEDCAAVARRTQQPWREIHRLALQQWYEHHEATSAGSTSL